jgi:YggT family protein
MKTPFAITSQVNLNKLPVNLVAWPTEPFLKVTRKVLPPAFGVDISPIAWVAFLSFLREILVSQQGLLTLIEQK